MKTVAQPEKLASSHTFHRFEAKSLHDWTAGTRHPWPHFELGHGATLRSAVLAATRLIVGVWPGMLEASNAVSKIQLVSKETQSKLVLNSWSNSGTSSPSPVLRRVLGSQQHGHRRQPPAQRGRCQGAERESFSTWWGPGCCALGRSIRKDQSLSGLVRTMTKHSLCTSLQATH